MSRIGFSRQGRMTHDAYANGAKVTFNGKRYVSKIAANVWAPDVYPAGWTLVS